ncbi:hypothetical protein J6590_108168, partial [Homalodisca vitripennis]
NELPVLAVIAVVKHNSNCSRVVEIHCNLQISIHFSCDVIFGASENIRNLPDSQSSW